MNDEKMEINHENKCSECSNEIENINNENGNNEATEGAASNDSGEKNNEVREEDIRNELEKLRTELKEANSKCEEYFNALQRIAAEFDNYRKRTQREKEALEKEVTCDVIASFIPVMDNLERALKSVETDCDVKTIREGIEMIKRQFGEILKKYEVQEIKSVGEKFDPNLHEAVMHVQDESYGENEIVEEFQKGYIMKDRVIRHSVVKVAN